MKNSECTFTCDQYTEYREDNLSDTLKAKVETHLASCEMCQKIFNELDQVLLNLKNIEPLETTPQFTQKLLTRIASENIPGMWQRVSSSSYTKIASYAVAAGLVVALGLNMIIDPVSIQNSGTINTFAVEETEPVTSDGSVAAGTDSLLDEGTDSLLLDRNTIDSENSSLQLVSGSSQ